MLQLHSHTMASLYLHAYPVKKKSLNKKLFENSAKLEHVWAPDSSWAASEHSLPFKSFLSLLENCVLLGDLLWLEMIETFQKSFVSTWSTLVRNDLIPLSPLCMHGLPLTLKGAGSLLFTFTMETPLGAGALACVASTMAPAFCPCYLLFLPKPDVVRLDPDLHILKVLSFSGQWESS